MAGFSRNAAAEELLGDFAPEGEVEGLESALNSPAKTEFSLTELLRNPSLHSSKDFFLNTETGKLVIAEEPVFAEEPSASKTLSTTTNFPTGDTAALPTASPVYQNGASRISSFPYADALKSILAKVYFIKNSLSSVGRSMSGLMDRTSSHTAYLNERAPQNDPKTGGNRINPDFRRFVSSKYPDNHTPQKLRSQYQPRASPRYSRPSYRT